MHVVLLARGPARFDWTLRVLFTGALLAGCGEKSEGPLREWQPSDHQPPPAAPQGQGAAIEGDSRKAAAAALWNMRCANCHGATGRGDGAGKPPGAALPDLTSPAFQDARSDEQLWEAVGKGKGLMPAFNTQLSDQGIKAIVEHVRSLRAH